MASQSTLLVLALHNERWLQEKCKHKKLCFCLRCILVEVTALTIFGAFWGFAEIHQSLDIVFRHLIINLQCILQVIFQIIYFQFEKSYLQWLLVDEVFGKNLFLVWSLWIFFYFSVVYMNASILLWLKVACLTPLECH